MFLSTTWHVSTVSTTTGSQFELTACGLPHGPHHTWLSVCAKGAFGSALRINMTSNYRPLVGTIRTRTRTNTNPNDTEANAAGRSGNARALRKQSKCGVYHGGEGHWPKFSQKMHKARHLWVARTPQKQ